MAGRISAYYALLLLCILENYTSEKIFQSLYFLLGLISCHIQLEWVNLSSVQSSLFTVSNSLRPHGLQHTRLPCPSLSPSVCSNPCPLSCWCHPNISPSVAPSSYRLQSFPASGSFSVSQVFTSGGQSIGASASASVLPVNIQGDFL